MSAQADGVVVNMSPQEQIKNPIKIRAMPRWVGRIAKKEVPKKTVVFYGIKIVLRNGGFLGIISV